jgi:hypothetical protein
VKNYSLNEAQGSGLYFGGKIRRTMEGDSQSNTRPARFPSLDLVAKSTATFVALIYGLGFVILTFHDAEYGVAQFSAFRARILLVGFVFVTVVTSAAAAQHYGLAQLTSVESIMKDTEPKRHIHREIILAAAFVYTAELISSILSNFLFYSVPAQKTSSPSLWRLIAALASFLLGLAIFILVGKVYLKRPKVAASLAVLAFAMAVTSFFLSPANSSPFNYLTVILFLVGWQTTWIKNSNDPIAYFLDYRLWQFPLIVLWLYISQVFGALPPRWGGGQPIPIQIFQNAPAPWSVSNPVDALLLDETDQGLYVLLSPSGRAYFVPRSNVASMFFGTKDQLSKKP